MVSHLPILMMFILAGQYVNVAVSFASSEWSDLSSFPCPASQFAEGANACDYSVHGWQTVPGNPNKVRAEGEGKGAAGGRASGRCTATDQTGADIIGARRFSCPALDSI